MQGGFDFAQFIEERVDAFGSEPSFQLRACFGIGSGSFEKTVQERFHVQPGSPDDQRDPSAAEEIGNTLSPPRAELPRGEVPVGRELANKVVGNERAELARGLGGPNVKVPVDLPGVRGDDLGVQRTGELDTDGGLSRRGGTHKGDDETGSEKRGADIGG